MNTQEVLIVKNDEVSDRGYSSTHSKHMLVEHKRNSRLRRVRSKRRK